MASQRFLFVSLECRDAISTCSLIGGFLTLSENYTISYLYSAETKGCTRGVQLKQNTKKLSFRFETEQECTIEAAVAGKVEPDQLSIY